jgi:hypothetical protein
MLHFLTKLKKRKGERDGEGDQAVQLWATKQDGPSSLSFAFHDSGTVLECVREAEEIGKIVTVLYLD